MRLLVHGLAGLVYHSIHGSKVDEADEFQITVEYLDSIIVTITDEQFVLPGDGQTTRILEFSGIYTLSSDFLHHSSIRTKLHNARLLSCCIGHVAVSRPVRNNASGMVELGPKAPNVLSKLIQFHDLSTIPFVH